MNKLPYEIKGTCDDPSGPRHSRIDRLLRWIEMQGLAWERRALRRGRATDAWWMAVGEELTGPHPFREVLAALVDGRGPVAVVHESEAHGEEPPWVLLGYRPLWRQPQVARWWGVGAKVMAAFGGYVGWQLFMPHSWSRAADALFLLAVAGILADTFTPAREMFRRVRGWLARRAEARAQARSSKAAALGKTVAVALLAGAAFLHWSPATMGALRAGGQAVWGQAAQWWRGGSPALSVAADARPSAEMSDAPAPAGATEPEANAEPTPLSPSPEAVAEERPLDLPTLLAQRRHLPPTVALTRALAFPALVQGRVAGQIEVPSGTELKLIAVRDEKLILEYRGATQPVAVEATDLLERVRAMTTATAAAAPLTPVSAAAQESPAAPSARNAIAAGALPVSGEVPGLPPQPAAYFRNLPSRP